MVSPWHLIWNPDSVGKKSADSTASEGSMSLSLLSASSWRMFVVVSPLLYDILQTLNQKTHKSVHSGKWKCARDPVL